MTQDGRPPDPLPPGEPPQEGGPIELDLSHEPAPRPEAWKSTSYETSAAAQARLAHPQAVRPQQPQRHSSLPFPEQEQRGWLQENLGKVVMAAMLVAAAGGIYLWRNRPVLVPDLAMKDSAGQSITFSAMRQDKPRLLVVFLMKGCSFSKYSLGELMAVHDGVSRNMPFVGLFMGSQAEAEQFGTEAGAPFPLYGLNEVQDPFALRELMEKVGVNTIASTGVYGGTVVVLDRGNKVLLRLEKEECKDLRVKLARL